MKTIRTILIAQNDPAATFPLSAAMQRAGWSPITTRDLDSTIVTARRRGPDAIILNSTLPGGGLEALKRLRSSAYTAATPIVCIIPESSPDRAEFAAAGCLAMVEPPVNPADVEALVKRQLTKAEPMQVPKSVIAESGRIRMLLKSGLMESPRDELFRKLSELITRILKVPTALVTVVGDDRQRFLGETGLPDEWSRKGESPLTHSFCQWVAGGQEDLVVADTREHPALKTNRSVHEMGVTAYAGVPFTLGAQTLGSVCAIDHQPRNWKPEDLELLRDISMIVEGHLASAATDSGAGERIAALSNAIIGAARVLQRDDIRTDERRELARMIAEKSKVLLKLTT